jgi:hypothetical protein
MTTTNVAFDQALWDSIEAHFDAGDLDTEYAEYIMEHTDAMVGNGDMLLGVMEGMKYANDFIDFTYRQRMAKTG